MISEPKTKVRIAREDILNKVLNFLIEYRKTQGHMPTLNEIAAGCGGKYKQWAWYYLRQLERNKKIKLTAGKHRGITIK